MCLLYNQVLNYIQFKISSNEHILNVRGGVDKGLCGYVRQKRLETATLEDAF